MAGAVRPGSHRILAKPWIAGLRALAFDGCCACAAAPVQRRERQLSAAWTMNLKWIFSAQMTPISYKGRSSTTEAATIPYLLAEEVALVPKTGPP